MRWTVNWNAMAVQLIATRPNCNQPEVRKARQTDPRNRLGLTLLGWWPGRSELISQYIVQSVQDR